jgi:type 1 fimbria pilin
MNKKQVVFALCAAPLLMMSTVANANGGGGAVNFSGTLVASPCNIATESVDQSITFDTLATSFLDAGNVSPMKPLTIKLTECDASSTTASVNFSGQTVTGVDNELATAGPTGTSVQITQAGTPVVFGVPVAVGNISPGDNTIQFGSHVKKATGATATSVGDFTAVTNFTMIYP